MNVKTPSVTRTTTNHFVFGDKLTPQHQLLVMHDKMEWPSKTKAWANQYGLRNLSREISRTKEGQHLSLVCSSVFSSLLFSHVLHLSPFLVEAWKLGQTSHLGTLAQLISVSYWHVDIQQKGLSEGIVPTRALCFRYTIQVWYLWRVLYDRIPGLINFILMSYLIRLVCEACFFQKGHYDSALEVQQRSIWDVTSKTTWRLLSYQQFRWMWLSLVQGSRKMK